MLVEAAPSTLIHFGHTQGKGLCGYRLGTNDHYREEAMFRKILAIEILNHRLCLQCVRKLKRIDSIVIIRVTD